MDEVRIRWDEELPDECLVLRGSRMAAPTLWTNFEQVKAETVSSLCPSGINAICVGVGVGSLSEIAEAMPYRGKWLRRSVLWRLREDGYFVYRLDDDAHTSHAVLILKDEPTGADWDGWDTLSALFGLPEPNPHH